MGNYDHLDIPTLERLAEEHHPRILVGLGNAPLLESEGIERGHEMDWWDSVELGGEVRITFLPCNHWSSRGVFDHGQTLWGAFAIEAPSGSIYFAGDTGYGPHFRQAAERYGPFRLALLPIGSYLPQWFMQAAHMSPAEAVKAHGDLGALHSIPLHYGTFPLGDDGYARPLIDLDRALLESGLTPDAFWILEPGEGRCDGDSAASQR